MAYIILLIDLSIIALYLRFTLIEKTLLPISFGDERSGEEEAQDTIYVANTLVDMDDGIDAE